MSKLKIKSKLKKPLSSQWEIIEDDIPMAQDGGILDLFYSKENENEKLLPQKQWLENWINHPEYEKRLINNLKEINDKKSFVTKELPYSFPLTFGEDYWKDKALNVKQDALKRLSKVKDFYAEGYDKNINLAAKYAKSMFPNEPEEAKYEALSLLYGSRGEYKPFTHSLFVNSSDATPSTGVHEYTHSTGMDSFLRPIIPQAKKVTEEYKRLEKENPGFNIDYDMLGNPMMSNYQNKGFFEKTKYIPSDSLKLNIPLSDIKYLNKSNEVYPRIMELRYNGQIKPGQIIDKKSFENIKKQSKNNQIFDMYSDEEIIEMMNKLAQNTENLELNKAEYGKSVKFQNGGKYPLIKEGGYDIKRALELGYAPDETGHMPSRDYKTGQYLKAKNYQTTPLSILYDELAGYKTRQDLNGNLYSIPREQQYPDFDLSNPPIRTFQNGGNTGYQWSNQETPSNYTLATPKNYNISKTSLTEQEEYKNLVLKRINEAEEANRKKYEPSQSVKNSKAILASAQLLQPYNSYLKAISTGADLSTALRYGLDGQYKKAGEDIIQAGIQWLPFLKGSPAMKQGTYNLSDLDKLINLGVSGTQKGSDIKTITEIKQSGGKIKTDPQGYWNEDNHGKPVRIPSNKITMKGVNQPLLGISDTGYMKMMYPNEEYQFDGNSVTEFPIMQPGGQVRQPIRGTREQYQAYQDSLDLYTTNRDRLAQLERESVYATNMFGQSGLYDNGLLSEHYTYLRPHQVIHNQYPLTNVPNNYENGNDRTYWGFENRRSNVTINPITYHGFDRRFRQNVIRGTNQTVNLPGQNDLHEYAGIWQFPQPVQPIIYQPSLQQIAQNPNPSIVRPSTTQTYQNLQFQKPKEVAVILDKKEQRYLIPQSGINPNTGKLYRWGDGSGKSYCPECGENFLELPKEFIKDGTFAASESEYDLVTGKAKIPYTPQKLPTPITDWFSRPRQRQEEGSGSLTDYFDKKTGKLLGTYKNGGKASDWEIID